MAKERIGFDLTMKVIVVATSCLCASLLSSFVFVRRKVFCSHFFFLHELRNPDVRVSDNSDKGISIGNHHPREPGPNLCRLSICGRLN